MAKSDEPRIVHKDYFLKNIEINTAEEIFPDSAHGDTVIFYNGNEWFVCAGSEKENFVNELKALIEKYRI